MSEINDRLIVALDLHTVDQSIKLVDDLGPLVQYYKVGMDAFYGMGHTILAQIASRDKKLFLDLKLHDIPTTVGSAVKALCQFSPAFISLHAAGGTKMLKAGVEAATEWAKENNRPRPRLIAITVLTSINEQDWVEIGSANSIRESVLRMSLTCKEAGVDGVIASPQEAMSIRALCGSDFTIITPGIRLVPERDGDQARTATPSQAFMGGADYLVVGRPIWSAAEPRKVTQSFLDNLSRTEG